MRIYLIFILWLLAVCKAGAQSRLYIPIDNQDCINCLSVTRYLGLLDSTTSPVLIFQKRYHRDSAALVRRLHLQPSAGRLLWSDSLYRYFRNNGAVNSDVCIYNAESGQTIRTGFVQLGENLPFLNRINKPTDTLTLDRPVFGGEAGFGNTGRYFYNFDGVSREMRVFDKRDNKHLYTLRLGDSLVTQAFRLRFGNAWQDQYNRTTAYTSAWQTVDPQAYASYYFHEDTVYLMAQHRYMIYPEEGAAEVNTNIFLSLSVYKSGKLIGFSIVENYLDALLKGRQGGIPRITHTGQQVTGKEACYIPGSDFFVYRGTLYLQINGGLSKGIPNHFLAKYDYDAADRTYKYQAFYDRSLPEPYDSAGYNYTNPGQYLLFSPPYTALYLNSHLYSLDPAVQDIDPGLFGRGNKPLTGKGLWDIRLGKEHLFVIYMDGSDNHYHYLKYNLRQQKVVADRPICNFKSPAFIATPMLDDIDYDYIYLPLDESRIVRKKMAD